ncbi:MAG: TIGR00645 family protein [Caulobacteraceae bacterium]
MDQTPRTSRKPSLERWLELGLYNARWLMAPFYVGLTLSLLLLLAVFVGEMVHEVPHVLETMSPEDAILLVLALIDLSLAGNLLLIVIFSGYENFVSKIDTRGDEDRPSWMGMVDFSGLKLKLIASIVAISAISLLRSFMKLGEGEVLDEAKLRWMVIIHVVFIISGVLLAIMDWISSNTESHAPGHPPIAP